MENRRESKEGEEGEKKNVVSDFGGDYHRNAKASSSGSPSTFPGEVCARQMGPWIGVAARRGARMQFFWRVERWCTELLHRGLGQKGPLLQARCLAHGCIQFTGWGSHRLYFIAGEGVHFQQEGE
jgi:hypothetical protein